MSSSSIVAHLACGFISCVLSTAQANTKAADICPLLHSNAIEQIYLFDGTPEELAYLAPDDNGNVYSVKQIYNQGRFVTVRCKYKSGSIIDVELKNRTKQCTFRPDKADYGNLRCR